MGMTSLKQDSADSFGEYRAPNFGYGTEIHLDGDQTEAMGLKRLAAGQEVTLKATGIVTRSTEAIESDGDSASGKEMCLSIQLTAVDVRPTGTANAQRAASILYGSSDE